MKRRTFIAWSLVTVLVLLAGTVAIGQDFDGPQSGLVTNLDNAIFPRTKVIAFGNDVGLFDTGTGELFRFRGDLRGSRARGTFDSVARPVADATSGFLQVQQVDEGTFLVDAVTGDVWILRQRSSNNASWVRVDVR